MTLLEMKKKILELIEEISDNPALTEDPDIEAKINTVINQVQYELCRMKKIPAYIELEAHEGDLIHAKDIDTNLYQIDVVRGLKYEIKADGTLIKCLEDGTLEIEYYKYPTRIDEETEDTYEFELDDDVLEILPYGVAADILKSDVSNNYGQIYSQRYETMLSRLDSRYNMGSIEFEKGVDI